jgi:hypothetical protein
MNDATSRAALSTAEHADAMKAYFAEGIERAQALGNRGPIHMGRDGKLHRDILDAYWKLGFYIFEGVVGAEELEELRADVECMLDHAPAAPDAKYDAAGRPAFGTDFVRPPYRFAKPLSDPLGGTTKNKGRHPVKMYEATPPTALPTIRSSFSTATCS